MKCLTIFYFILALGAAGCCSSSAVAKVRLTGPRKQVQTFVFLSLSSSLSITFYPCSDLKKKISLRDERITSLEASMKSSALALRSQTEAHITELTLLREQMKVLRSEGQQSQQSQLLVQSRRSSMENGGGMLHSGTRQVLRGGGTSSNAASALSMDKVIVGRTVRGGGGFEDGGGPGGMLRPTSPLPSGGSKRGSFFSKILGSGGM